MTGRHGCATAAKLGTLCFRKIQPYGSPMRDLRYLKAKDEFLKYAHLALGDHFPSRDAFVNYFEAIKTDELKNHFLKTASFYLFLVKQGDWVVDVSGRDQVVDYFTNTYKYVAIFALIESLSKKRFIDFYEFLTRLESRIEFPIADKDILAGHYRKYKEQFGSISRCISFFRALSPERQSDLVSRLEVEGTNATIENLAKYLYDMRSKFVHEAGLVLHMSQETSIGLKGDKIVVCKLSIKDAMMFFEEGLIGHFRSTEA
jgi:hypothetical protein